MYYDSLIKYLSPFFSENEITPNQDGSFSAKGKNIRISYNEATKCYDLAIANDGEEPKTVSSYLFDETQNEKDVESVAIDFSDTLRKYLSISKKRTAQNIALPTHEGGETISLSGLTQKLLAIFPENKEEYKNHVAQHNRFLATRFYRECLIPDIKKLLNSNNKKQIKKFYDAVLDIFVHGDEEASTYTVSAVAAALYGNKEGLDAAKDFTEECTTYHSNLVYFSATLKSNKKLRQTLIKE